MDTWRGAGGPGCWLSWVLTPGGLPKGPQGGCGFKDEWVSAGEEGWEATEGEGLGQTGGALREGERQVWSG